MSAPKKNISTTQIFNSKPENFEAAYAELEALVAEMESGDMALDASLNAYKRGNFLLLFCQQALGEVEQTVQILNAKNTLDAFTPIND
jgi:exodeoxyribonuclease VII small subunit